MVSLLLIHPVPVVLKFDNAINWINNFAVDNATGLRWDCVLSRGLRYLAIEHSRRDLLSNRNHYCNITEAFA